MSAAVWIRTLLVFDHMDARSDECKRSILTQGQAKNSFRFCAHAKLLLIVKRALKGAEVEIEAHSLKLRTPHTTGKRLRPARISATAVGSTTPQRSAAMPPEKQEPS